MSAEKIAALEAENAQLKAGTAALAVREAAIAKSELAHTHAANVAFCEQLVTEGKLHPKLKDNAAALLSALPADQAVEFAEVDGKKSDKPLVDALKAMLTAQPKIVEFGEAMAGQRNQVDVDDPAAVARKAVEFQESEAKAGRHVNTGQAVAYVLGQ